MTIDIRGKKTEQNKTNSKKQELTPKCQHMPSKRHLTETELIQVVGGDGPGDPDYTGQQHNEHHLRWKEAGRDQTDSQKREPKLKRERKPGKQHLTERELSQVVGADDPGDPPPPYGGQQHNEHHLQWKKVGRARRYAQKLEPRLKRERKPSKQYLTERELSQVVGGDDPGDPPPPYSSQQHNEHYLRWKKDRRDSKKRLLKRSKPH